MSVPAIEIENLYFKYPVNSGVKLENFSLVIKENERFGLFGPNGAGKSTLMSLMTGILKADKGSIKLFGTDITHGKRSDYNRIFGFVPQDLSFYQELSPLENLEFFGAWYGLPRNYIRQCTRELLDVMGLTQVKNKPVAQFSGGMKRRLNLAIGVMHKPRVVILDEPTVGVDVQTRSAITDYLVDLNKNGTTLLYTSHQLNEAERLCTHVALMDQGSIIVQNQLPVLLEEFHEEGLEGLFLHLTGKAYRDH